MTSFLNSLKDDLLDRRLLPLVAVVAVGLLAAVGYVALGGGSSAATPSGPAATASAAPPAGLSVSRITPEKAVAETTAGVADQRKGAAHNPFTPLPEPAEKKTTLKLASANGASPSSASGPTEPSSSSSAPGESSAPAPTPAPAGPPKPTYHVAVLFGVAPAAGTPEPEKQLTPYENLKLLAPLPSAKQALVVFRGVTAGGKTATFTIVSEAILHGQAKCLPSEEQCQAIALQPGQAETLEYVSASGQPVTYELQLVGITSSTGSGSGSGSGSGVQSILRDESKAGRELLRHEGLSEVPGLRYSAAQGVLVHAGH
jgi:hypothetical protein